MGRRVLAFFLGMIFGIVFLVGGIGLGAYLAVTLVTPSDISSDSSTYLGDLADMSLLDIGNSLRDLYLQKVGVKDTDGRYFSLGDFCQNYNIDLTAALGTELPQSVMNVPVFEFFAQDGLNNAMQQVTVGSIPAVLNLFASKDEEGNGFVDAEIVEKLDAFSLTELLDETKGIPYVFAEIRLADLLPDSFPPKDSNNALMWAIGQGSIGKLYGSFGGSDSLLMQVKQGGGLEELGKLPISDLMGGSSGILGAMLDDATLNSLVDENGALNVDQILGKTYLGNVLGCIRNQIEDVSDFDVCVQDEATTILVKNVDGKNVFACADGNKYYQADVFCYEQDVAHVHTPACFDFVWYNSSAMNEGHTGCSDDELIAEDGHHARTNGLYKALVNLSLSDLMSGSSDAIVDGLKNITLRELVNGEVSGIMANFSDMTVQQLLNGGIDGMYLGSFFNYTRIAAVAPESYTTVTNGFVASSAEEYVLSDDGKDWYRATLVCDDNSPEHNHSRQCFAYVWMNGNEVANGMMAKLSEIKISELGNLNDTIQSFTLADVMGENNLSGMLLELKDVQLKNLSSQMSNVYLGSAMNNYRKSVSTDGYTTIPGTNNVLQNADKFAKSNDGEKWYEAELDCKDSHSHNDDCYVYVWYKNAACTMPVTGIQKAFVNSTLNGISDTMENLTLGKLGIAGNNNILKALSDTPLNSLSSEMNKMKMGVVFGFAEVTTGETTVWYEPCKTGCGHTDEQHVTLEGESGYFTPAKGINAKMSNMTLTELASGSGMTKIVSNFTIAELQDSGVVKLTEEQEYKLDIMFDDSPETDPTHTSLGGYFTAKAMTPSLTAKQYYQSKHGADQTYRGKWKDLPITLFIQLMLNSI